MNDHKPTEALRNQAQRNKPGRRLCFHCRRPFKSINKDCKCWCHQEAEEEAAKEREKRLE